MAGLGGASAATTTASAPGPTYQPPPWTCQSPECPITINDYVSGSEDRAASPYPSDICCVVSDPPSFIDTITVTLNGLTHTSLDNVDVLLVSVNGTAVELMSDVGGSFPVSGLDLR